MMEGRERERDGQRERGGRDQEREGERGRVETEQEREGRGGYQNVVSSSRKSRPKATIMFIPCTI